MRMPNLEKRYKVIWEYYFNSRRKHQKTFEYISREQAISLVEQLRKFPVTSKVSVGDYHGHYKDFVLRLSDSMMKERQQLLDKVAAVMGDDADKFMKSLGDSRAEDLPLAIRTNLEYLNDRRTLEKYIGVLLSGEATDTSLYVVAGIPVWRVMMYCAEVERGERVSVPADFKLTEYQCRLLRGVKMWTPVLLKRKEGELV